MRSRAFMLSKKKKKLIPETHFEFPISIFFSSVNKSSFKSGVSQLCVIDGHIHSRITNRGSRIKDHYQVKCELIHGFWTKILAIMDMVKQKKRF